jgi:hypothetical protein
MSIADGAVSNDSVSGDAGIERSKLEQTSLAIFPIPVTQCRVHDAMQTLLPNPSANDDLGLYGGAFGTNHPAIKTSDLKAAGATTRYARLLIPIPAEYDGAETVQIRVKAGMETTVADNTATVDLEASECDKDGTVSADLCTTDAQSINNLTAANKDFTITATDLVAGDILDVRIAVAVNDAATGTAVTAAVYTVELLCDIRG